MSQQQQQQQLVVVVYGREESSPSVSLNETYSYYPLPSSYLITLVVVIHSAAPNVWRTIVNVPLLGHAILPNIIF